MQLEKDTEEIIEKSRDICIECIRDNKELYSKEEEEELIEKITSEGFAYCFKFKRAYDQAKKYPDSKIPRNTLILEYYLTKIKEFLG